MFKNEQPLYVIYMVTNSVNGKSYIGKTVQGLKDRWDNHLSKARRGVGYYFHKAIRKYGEDCWDIKIMYVSFEKDDKHLFEVEEQLVAEYDTFHKGYNSCPGGRGTGSGKDHPRWGMRHTPKTLSILSAIHKGNQYWLGKKHTEESKVKMSASNTGRVISKSTKDKLSLANSGENNPMFGKPGTNLGKTFSKKTRNRMSKAIRQAPLRSSNKTGVTGLSVVNRKSKWVVHIFTNGKQKRLGAFIYKNDAIIARLMAELQYWNQIKIYDY